MLKCIYVISTIVFLSAICQMQPVQKKSIYSSLSGSVDQMIRRVFTRIESWGDRFFDLIPFVGKKITRTQRRIIIISTIITIAFVARYLSVKARNAYIDATIIIHNFKPKIWNDFRKKVMNEPITYGDVPFLEKIVDYLDMSFSKISFLTKLQWLLSGKSLDDLYDRYVSPNYIDQVFIEMKTERNRRNIERENLRKESKQWKESRRMSKGE